MDGIEYGYKIAIVYHGKILDSCCTLHNFTRPRHLCKGRLEPRELFIER